MKYHTIGGLLTLSVVLLGPGFLFADQPQETEGEGPTALVSQATISIEQAIRAVQDKFTITVVKAELEKEDDKTVWEIEFVTADGKTMEAYVDATNGEILEIEEED